MLESTNLIKPQYGESSVLYNVLVYVVTYHPFNTIQTPHLTSRVNGRHPILRSNVERSARLQNQKFEYVQMTLLGRQVYRRYVIVHLSVGAAKTIKSIN